MEATMARKALLLFSMIMGLASFTVFHVCGEHSQLSDGHDNRDKVRKMQAFRASFVRHDSVSLPPSVSPSPTSARQPPPVNIYIYIYIYNFFWVNVTDFVDDR
jgi:hypothetical protein